MSDHHHEGPGEHRGGQEGGQGRDCCGGGESHDDQTAASWERAFWTALEELQTEAVKAKLKAKWGERIEGLASATVEAMEAEWETFHKREAAREAFRERLRKTFEQGPR